VLSSSTSSNLFPESDLSISQPIKEYEIQSKVGQQVVELARNILPREAVALFTEQKLKDLKHNGLSLSDPLSTSQLDRIVAELGVYRLTAQLSKRQVKKPDENDLKQQIFNFSVMNDEELSTHKKTLENQLNRMEKEAHIRFLMEDLSEALGRIEKESSFPINPEEMLLYYHDALQQAAKQDPEKIPNLAAEWTRNIQANAEILEDRVQQGWNFFSNLARHQYLKLPQNFIDQQMLALASLGEKLHQDSKDFRSTIDSLYEDVTPFHYSKDLLTHLQNPTHRQAWNQLMEEIQDVQELIDTPLSEQEVKKVKMEIAKSLQIVLIESEKKTQTLGFEARYIQPILKARNQALQTIHNQIENNRLFQRTLDAYHTFLVEKAQTMLQNSSVPESLLSEQIEETTRLFFFPAIFPRSIFDQPLDKFKDSIESIKKSLYEQERTSSWLAKVACYQKVGQLQQNPKEFVDQLWKLEMGSVISAQRQQKLNEVIEEAIEITNYQRVTQKHVARLRDSIVALRPEINRLELADLEQRLSQDPDILPAVAQEIMRDWTVIGRDIQNNLALLDEGMKERVLQIAKNRSQLHGTLEQIQKDLEQHVVTPSPVVIKSKYQQLRGLLSNFPDQKSQERYNLMINKALLQQELTKRQSPTYSRGSTTENQVLEWLDFEPQQDYQNAATHQLIEDMLQSQQLCKKSIAVIKSEIQEAEYSGRLKAAGVADNALENMKNLIRTVDKLKQNLAEKLTQLALKASPIDQFADLPKVELVLSRNRVNAVKKEVNRILKKEFEGDSKLKRNLTKDPQAYEEKYLSRLTLKELGLLEPSFEKTIKHKIAGRLKDDLAFYKKWKNRLVIDAIQGLEDPNEDLKEGVCQAKCLRVGSFEQENPDLPIDQLGGEQVSALDRFVQSRYDKAFDDLKKLGKTRKQIHKERLALPEEVYSSFGYDTVTTVGTVKGHESEKTIKKMGKQIKDLAEDHKHLSKSNGVIHIGIGLEEGGHAMHCRLDFKRNIFRFHDPNIGIFEIPARKRHREEAVRELSELFTDIMQTFYSDVTKGHLYQLTKKQPKDES
jgi:hypothetical protein